MGAILSKHKIILMRKCPNLVKTSCIKKSQLHKFEVRQIYLVDRQVMAMVAKSTFQRATTQHSSSSFS